MNQVKGEKVREKMFIRYDRRYASTARQDILPGRAGYLNQKFYNTLSHISGTSCKVGFSRPRGYPSDNRTSERRTCSATSSCVARTMPAASKPHSRYNSCGSPCSMIRSGIPRRLTRAV